MASTSQPKNEEGVTWKKVAKWIAIGVVAREAFLTLGPMRQRRRDAFNQAVRRVNETGKRLIVIGDPDGGIVNRFLGRDYDCGDLCIDRVGCLSCPTYVQGRLEDELPRLETDSAVVFVSMTLEYVDNIDVVLAELDRVSGGDLFVATVSPWTLTAFLYPGARRQFVETQPDDKQFRWRTHWWTQHKSPNRTYSLPPHV